MLLGNLQKDRTTTVKQIAEIIADAQGTQKEEEELDEGDPRNCELYIKSELAIIYSENLLNLQ